MKVLRTLLFMAAILKYQNLGLNIKIIILPVLIMKILIKVLFMAAILKSKMAAIEPVQKNGTKANFVPWVIWTKKTLVQKM